MDDTDLVFDIAGDTAPEISAETAADFCLTHGCSPRRALADNGFTYEIICGRCGKLLE